jgi:hypothetical protein
VVVVLEDSVDLSIVGTPVDLGVSEELKILDEIEALKLEHWAPDGGNVGTGLGVDIVLFCLEGLNRARRCLSGFVWPVVGGGREI